MAMTYRWGDAEKTVVHGTDGTALWSIPADPMNPQYERLLADKTPIADYVAPAPAPEPTDEQKMARAGIKREMIAAIVREEMAKVGPAARG